MQRHSVLDRRDVDDDTCALADHGWQKKPIQPNRREQVQIERFLPFGIIQSGVTAGRGRGAAKDVHDDVEPTQFLSRGCCGPTTTFGRGEVGLNEIGSRDVRRACPSGGQHSRSDCL
jgi:hypothetical protein